MSQQYEPSNPLSMPFECFSYNSVDFTFPIRPHRHYFAQLVLVRQGCMVLSFDNGTLNLEQGQACYIYPHKTHSISCLQGSMVYYDVIKLDEDRFSGGPAYGPGMNQILRDVARQNMPHVFTEEQVRRMGISERISHCVDQVRARDYGYDLIVRSQLYVVLTQLLKEWRKMGFSVQQKVFASPLFGSMDSVTSYIEANLRTSLKVEQVAEYCGMSYNSFARKFRQLFGISCKEYIEQVRVALVEHYLRFTDWELNYISQETGFTDCSHMIRDFRRMRGITPGKYRADIRGES